MTAYPNLLACAKELMLSNAVSCPHTPHYGRMAARRTVCGGPPLLMDEGDAAAIVAGECAANEPVRVQLRRALAPLMPARQALFAVAVGVDYPIYAGPVLGAMAGRVVPLDELDAYLEPFRGTVLEADRAAVVRIRSYCSDRGHRRIAL